MDIPVLGIQHMAGPEYTINFYFSSLVGVFDLVPKTIENLKWPHPTLIIVIRLYDNYGPRCVDSGFTVSIFLYRFDENGATIIKQNYLKHTLFHGFTHLEESSKYIQTICY